MLGNHTERRPLSSSPPPFSLFVIRSPPSSVAVSSPAKLSFCSSYKEQLGLLWLKMRILVFILDRIHLHPDKIRFLFWSPCLILYAPSHAFSFLHARGRLEIVRRRRGGGGVGAGRRRTRLGCGDLSQHTGPGVPAWPLHSPLRRAPLFSWAPSYCNGS